MGSTKHLICRFWPPCQLNVPLLGSFPALKGEYGNLALKHDNKSSFSTAQGPPPHREKELERKQSMRGFACLSV